MNKPLKYGLIIGTIISLCDACNFFFLYKTPYGILSSLIIFLTLTVGIFLGIRSVRQHSEDKKISFGNASLTGVTITLFAAILFGLITFLFNQNKNPEFHHYIETETEKMMLEKKSNPIAIEAELSNLKSKTPFDQGKGAFLGTSIIGVVCSFVFGFILRNKYYDPSLPEQFK